MTDRRPRSDPTEVQDAAAIAESIRAEAHRLGFDQVGFARAALSPEMRDRLAADLDGYVQAGHHGSMEWMAETQARRSHPQTLWPEAVSVICLGANYGPPETASDLMARLERRDRATISAYARHQDYHDVLKKAGKALCRFIHGTWGAEVKIFVDTAPVMEKPLAAQAGLGWQGKHTNLVSRQFGSWLFLAEVFTTVPLPPDQAHADRCGSCRACLDVCPTGALPAPYRIDARACLSYLTIEHKGPIPVRYRRAMGNRIYGCDDCLAVCPWNRFARESKQLAFLPRDELEAPVLRELSRLDDMAFRALFRKSPIKRLGRDRFTRNVLVALGNSGDAEALADVRRCQSDPDPVVREAADWAYGELERAKGIEPSS